MNRKFLGDALDSWKGALLSRAVGSLLVGLRIDPLLSDPPWSEDEFVLYADLLQVQRSAIISHEMMFARQREAYIGEISKKGDIFLDPDTGVATHKVNTATQVRYITPGEIRDLAAAAPERVVSVYQHVSRIATRKRVQRVVSILQQTDPRLHITSSESATVAMLFVSHSGERIENIYHFLNGFFRSKAVDRTAVWVAPEKS